VWAEYGGYMKTVHYSQGDKRWRDHPYANDANPKATVRSSGCGPSSAAMVVSSMTNLKVTPPEMADLSLKFGTRGKKGTDWGYFAKVAEWAGLSHKATKDLDLVYKRLVDGQHLVVASMGAGHFTDGGHFITLIGAGTDTSGQRWFRVLDPSKNNKNYFEDDREFDDEIMEDLSDSRSNGSIYVKLETLQREGKKFFILGEPPDGAADPDPGVLVAQPPAPGPPPLPRPGPSMRSADPSSSGAVTVGRTQEIRASNRMDGSRAEP
jgi:hypothetical protein